MDSFAEVDSLVGNARDHPNKRGTDWERDRLEPIEPTGFFRYLAPKTVNPPPATREAGARAPAPLERKDDPASSARHRRHAGSQQDPAPRPRPSARFEAPTDFSAVESLLASAPARTMPTLRDAVSSGPPARRQPAPGRNTKPAPSRPPLRDMDDEDAPVAVDDAKHNAAEAPRNEEDADGDTAMDPVGPSRVVESQWTGGCCEETPCGSAECERCASVSDI